MKGAPYQNFVAMGQDKRESMIEKQKQKDPSPIGFGDFKFPDQDFIKLEGVQDKKPIKLATYRYPAENPKGVVIFFHTIGLYTGLAAHMGDGFSKNGYTFVGYDQRGHGRSEGEKGYFDNSKQVLNNAVKFVSEVVKLYPNVPLFLMGQGLGGLLSIILHKEAKIKVSGMILISPALKRPGGKVMGALSGFALNLLPNRKGLFNINFENHSQNPNVTKYLLEDPLVYHDKMMVGSLMQMAQIMQKNPEDEWKKLATPPIVVAQGELDKIMNPMNAINFYEKIKSEDKEFWWYPNTWNNILLEKQYENFEKRAIEWFNKRL